MYILNIKKNKLTPTIVIPYMTKSGAILHKEKLEKRKFKYKHIEIKKVKTVSELDCMEVF